ncbi:head completion protein [uncultured Caudovirales phage]|uniref:Head completion nuclease n=1 Tax=uncultured Caudovirales phage TaxID=2100421 RepID=A0A6J7WGX2_9CAUD|nr:head completion protein [uncultured Caudovirales phage]
MSKYAQGKFQLQNPQKYVGNKTPTYRSSWEYVFMQFCDNNPNILQWASEAVHINYKNPLTGKNTIYVPDFLLTYQDAHGKPHAEVVEVKPKKETTLEGAKNVRDQAAAILNMAKWEAARIWCKAHGMTFRIVTEDMIFHQGRK